MAPIYNSFVFLLSSRLFLLFFITVVFCYLCGHFQRRFIEFRDCVIVCLAFFFHISFFFRETFLLNIYSFINFTHKNTRNNDKRFFKKRNKFCCLVSSFYQGKFIDIVKMFCLRLVYCMACKEEKK